MVVTKKSVQGEGELEARADTSTPSQEGPAVAEQRKKAEVKVEGWRYVGSDAVVNVVTKDVPGIPSTTYEFRNGETVNLVEGQVNLAGNPEFEQVDPR